MTQEPKHKDTGESLSEVIAQIPAELPLDAVGIWQIIPTGQVSFGLSGAALASFVRAAVLALLDAGAVPVRHIPGTGYDWVRQKQYGESREEIADAVVQEWLTIPDDPMLLVGECPWFARPIPGKNYVKLD